MIHSLLLFSSLAFAQDKPLNPADQAMSADFGASYQTQLLDQMGITLDRITKGRPKLSSYITTYGSITFATAGRGITWADGSISTSASGSQGPPGPPGAGEENTYTSSKTFTSNVGVTGSSFSVAGTTFTVGGGRIGVNRTAASLTRTMEVNGRFHVGAQSAREPEIANTRGDPTDTSYGFYSRGNFGMYMPDDTTLAFSHNGSSAIVIGSKGGIYISTPIIQGAGPVVNVKAYGAVGNGVTSDQAAIMYAMSVLPSTGGVLYFPAGHQYLVSSIVVSSRVTLASDAGSCQITGSGDQFCGAILVSTTTTAPIVKYTVEGGAYSNISRSRWWVAMKNIGVKGSATVDGNSHGILGNLNGQHCVQIDNHGATVENVTLMRCGGNGLYLTSSVSGVFNNITIQASNGNGVLIDNSSNPISASNNNNFFNSLRIDSNGGSAFRINREGQGNVLNGLNCDGNNQYCIDFNALGYGKGGTTNGTSFNRFSGIWSENNVNGDLHVGTAAANNKFDFVHHTSSMTYDVNYGLNLVSGSSTTGANFIDTAIYDTMGNIRTAGGFDSSDDDHLHIRNRTGTADGLLLAKRFASSAGLADNVRMPTSLPQSGAFNVYNGQGMDSRNSSNTANYTIIASNSENGVSLGDATQGNVRVLPSTFTVGTSSFVVSGGSATVAYLMTARAFVGDGSGLTNLPGGSGETNTYTSSKTFTQDVLIRGQLNVQGSSATVQYGIKAQTATFTSSVLVGAVSGLGTNALDVKGSAAFGTYGSAVAAPSNGLIVSGNVGIGNSSPGSALHVTGSEIISSTLTVQGNAFSVGRSTFAILGGDIAFGASAPTTGNYLTITPISRTVSVIPGSALNVKQFTYTYNSAGGVFGNQLGTVTLEKGTYKQTGGGSSSYDNGGTLYIPSPPSCISGVTCASSSTILMGGGVGQKIEVSKAGSGIDGQPLTIRAGNANELQLPEEDHEGGSIIIQSGKGHSLAQTAGFDGDIRIDPNPNGVEATSGRVLIAYLGGKVGVGTSTPNTKFDVNGDARFGTGTRVSTFTTSADLVMASGSSITLSGANGFITGASSITASAFFGNGSGLTNVSAAFNGGTVANQTTFQSTVTVQGDSFSVGLATFGINGGSAFIGISTGDYSFWQATQGGGAHTLFIGNGELANSPVSTIYTSSRSTTNGRLASIGNVYYGKTRVASIDVSKNGDDTNSGSFQFGTANQGSGVTTRMVITSTGNVGIGTSTPLTPLQVAGEVSASSYTISGSTIPFIHGVQKKMANATTVFYSSNTDVNITGLDFSLTNNTSYFFQYDMVVQSTLAASGVWAGMVRPAGSTITWTVIYNTAYTGATLGSNNGTTVFSAASGASVHAVNVDIPLTLWGHVITGSSGGTLQPVIKGETTTSKGLVRPWSRGKLELLE